MRSVENEECIKKGYKKILSYLGSQCFMQNTVKALLSGNERTDLLLRSIKAWAQISFF